MSLGDDSPTLRTSTNLRIAPLIIAAALIGYWLGYQQGLQTGSKSAPPSPTAPSSPSTPGTVTVLDVIDGDTLKVLWHGEPTSVRLLNINAPDRGQDGFDNATAAMEKLLGKGPARLEFEKPGKVERDRYGRLLAYVFNGEGQCVNVELVRLGLSPYWVKYGRGRLAEEFEGAAGG